eukprot:6196246-Pleurochrysis_carterae.AAC.2
MSTGGASPAAHKRIEKKLDIRHACMEPHTPAHRLIPVSRGRGKRSSVSEAAALRRHRLDAVPLKASMTLCGTQSAHRNGTRWISCSGRVFV